MTALPVTATMAAKAATAVIMRAMAAAGPIPEVEEYGRPHIHGRCINGRCGIYLLAVRIRVVIGGRIARPIYCAATEGR